MSNTTEKILIPAAEAAALLSMGKSTFWREVSRGTLPAPIKIREAITHSCPVRSIRAEL